MIRLHEKYNEFFLNNKCEILFYETSSELIYTTVHSFPYTQY